MNLKLDLELITTRSGPQLSTLSFPFFPFKVFIWMILKMSRYWLPSYYLFNLKTNKILQKLISYLQVGILTDILIILLNLIFVYAFYFILYIRTATQFKFTASEGWSNLWFRRNRITALQNIITHWVVRLSLKSSSLNYFLQTIYWTFRIIHKDWVNNSTLNLQRLSAAP